MPSIGCLLQPTGCLGTSLARATIGDLLGSVTQLVVTAVQWELGLLLKVLATTNDTAVVANGTTRLISHFNAVVPLLVTTTLLIGVIDGIRRVDSGALWRLLIFITPATLLVIASIEKFSNLLLTMTNQLTQSLASSSPNLLQNLVAALSKWPTALPGFGVVVLAVGGFFAAGLLWLELVARNVGLGLVVVVAPLLLPLGLIPGLRRVGWRLLETFLTLAMVKVMVLVTLELGAAEITAGGTGGMTTGVATVFISCLAPLFLLRLVPVFDRSSLQQFDRWRAATSRSLMSLPTTPVGQVLSKLRPEPRLEIFQPGGDFGIPLAMGEDGLDFPNFDVTPWEEESQPSPTYQAPPPPVPPPVDRPWYVEEAEFWNDFEQGDKDED